MVSFIIRNSILLLNILIAFALFLGFLGCFYYDYHYASINILALVIPVLYSINVLFLLSWLLFTRTKKYALISLLPILLCCFIFNRFYNLTAKESSEGDFSVMTYNIKSFTPYHSFYTKDSMDKFKAKNYALIDSIQPDILCLQEFSERGKEIRKKFKHHILNFGLKHKWYRPTMILTNFPIVNHFSIDFEGYYANNLVADLKIGNDTIRVFNIHMESLSLSSHHMNQINSKDTKVVKKVANHYYKNLNNGFLQHQKQIDKIMNEVKKSPYPVILCGDFNNTPFSYEYNQCLSILQDSYLEVGKGIVDTYHNVPFPTRIDHIFLSKYFTVNQYTTINNTKISDHYPVKVTFSLKNNK